MKKEAKSKKPDHQKNIRALIRLMQRVKRNEEATGKRRLYMGAWMRNKTGKSKPGVDDILHNCGSTACVAGFVAIHPPFLKQGIEMHYEGKYPVVKGRESMPYEAGFIPAFRHLFGFDEEFTRQVTATRRSDQYPEPETCDQVITLLKTRLEK